MGGGGVFLKAQSHNIDRSGERWLVGKSAISQVIDITNPIHYEQNVSQAASTLRMDMEVASLQGGNHTLSPRDYDVQGVS